MKIRKKEQKRLIITYQITMALLAIVSILLIVMDLSRAITITAYPYSLVDNLIWGIFTLDYLIRLWRAKNKKEFFVHNIFDLLSIIPVNLAFSIFRINRLGRLFVVIRLLRLTRLVGLIRRLRYFLKFNGLIYYLYISISVLAITSIMFSIAENRSIWASLWLAITTSTTVGYGDITPHTVLGKISAVFDMLVGIGSVGVITGNITALFSRRPPRNEHSLKKLHHENQTILKQNADLIKQNQAILNELRILKDQLQNEQDNN